MLTFISLELERPARSQNRCGKRDISAHFAKLISSLWSKNKPYIRRKTSSTHQEDRTKQTRAMVKEEAPKITPVYLRNADNCWVPALQLKTHNGKATVSLPKFKSEKDMLVCQKASKTFKYGDNEVVDLKDYPNGVLPMQNVDGNGNLEEYKDMVGAYILSPSFCL
jgi:hypothetical protein